MWKQQKAQFSDKRERRLPFNHEQQLVLNSQTISQPCPKPILRAFEIWVKDILPQFTQTGTFRQVTKPIFLTPIWFGIESGSNLRAAFQF